MAKKTKDSYQRIVEDRVWANKFLEYCLNKPELTEYIFREREKIAMKYKAQKNFEKAAEIYRDVIGQCGPNQEKAIYELKLQECLYHDGQYESVIQNLDNFIKDNKAIHRVLVVKAIMLKGQTYVQMGDIDRATDTFLTLIVEYPKAKESPEANFFVGYCYMLQDKFDEATQAFNLVLEDYSQSSYVSKARLYLTRFESMIE